MNSDAKPDTGVLIGDEGFLFLGGGNHSPLLYARGDREINPDSIRTFWKNIQRRKASLERRGVEFVHVIAPDKHSVCKTVFPQKISVLIGERYLSAAPNSELSHAVKYPLDNLTLDFRHHCYRVDTHFRPTGTAVLLHSVLDHFSLGMAKAFLDTHIRNEEQKTSGWSGDLGSKLNPQQSEDRFSIKLPITIQTLSNKLAGGNNGIIDLYLNRSETSPPLGRVLVFGDSYGRDMASLLAPLARQLLFLRTPFCHIDLVDAARPDIVITENAERYLSNVVSDEDRPVFFLFPFFKEQEYHMSSDCAKALSAFFSAGRPSAQFLNFL